MIYRIEVRTAPAAQGGPAAVDPVGEAVRHQITEFGLAPTADGAAGDVGPIQTARIFLIDADAPADHIRRAARELLADPIVEQAEVIPPATTGETSETSTDANAAGDRIEIHLKPGVMDPVAASTEMALRDLGLAVREVRTGRAYLFDRPVPRADLLRIANRVLANGVIEAVHFDAYVPAHFQSGREDAFNLRRVALRDLTDDQLTKLSREGHLFLSMAEMKAIQSHFRTLGREPTDIELETLAQTWSEHCVHKTLKSAVDVEVRDAAGGVVSTRRYENLIKETIFQSTMELTAGGQDTSFCLSVFADNAGVIAFDETDAVCFKVETHNHPSAIEPYGGSATGAGGVIRDILGTGLAAKPVANTDVFCVGFPTKIAGISAVLRIARPFTPTDQHLRELFDAKHGEADMRYVLYKHPTHHFLSPIPFRDGELLEQVPALEGSDLVTRQLVAAEMQQAGIPIVGRQEMGRMPKGIIHPKRILQQVVAGVRDYGNRMGIPTVNGAVYFDDRYLGNPLVFCGCVGLLPRTMIHKQTGDGDAIVVMGGRTGRDGIHGATFSSAELTDTHADEFSHAVQIGNAITEKKVADVILQARDRGLFTSVTDCGAGGLSSAIGEMGEKVGARVELDLVPLKYAGLRYDEIWISEAQERMVLAVPQRHVAALLALSKSEDVEATVIGTFGTAAKDAAGDTGPQLVLNYRGQEVGRMSMDFLHHGIPKPTRKAVVYEGTTPQRGMGVSPMQSLPHGRDAHATSTGFAPVKPSGPDLGERVKRQLLNTLAHPNVASKHWIIRQYDHEVQGGSVIKPLIGPRQVGPSDAAVLRPKLGSTRGIALGCGLAPHVADPYRMAVASIDEAIRNVVAVGADPARVAILDNFCWPSVDDEQTMGTLVRACEACYDAAIAYGIPFISGKDSLHNQFTNGETGEVIRIPSTLLISAIAVLDDVRKCVTMDFDPANHLGIIRQLDSHPELAELASTHRRMADAIRQGLVVSCHDVSDGGPLTAAAEMVIASGIGLNFTAPPALYFSETPGQYLIEYRPEHADELREAFDSLRVTFEPCGMLDADSKLTLTAGGQPLTTLTLDELTRAWRGTLDW